MKAMIKVILLLAASMYSMAPVWAQIPTLSSYSYARATIYLDFDGEYVTGSSWNWNGAINAQQADLATKDIKEIFNRVSEDYRPFNINVTTDPQVYDAAPFNYRIRIIVTATSSWYGSAGGVSYIGSFTWGDETPAWVFSSLLGNNVKYIAEACSHEAGHTLGLQHQSVFDNNCNKMAEYNVGQGEGETGWAPIMGIGYYKNLTTWHVGTSSAGCNSVQNDLDILGGETNGFGFREDDHGNSLATATSLIVSAEHFASTGLINRPEDSDIFKLELNSLMNLKMSIIPGNVGPSNQGADVDLKLALLNSVGDTLAVYNPATMLSIQVDTTLNSGTYYLSITATANANHSAYGSLGLYAITGTVDIPSPIHRFILAVKKRLVGTLLNWNFPFNTDVQKFIIEMSKDGKTFIPVATLNGSTKIYSYNALTTSCYYRLRAITIEGGHSYYSNTSYVGNTKEFIPVHVLSNVVQTRIMITGMVGYSYQLFQSNGAMFSSGKLSNGLNEINISRAPNGIILLRVSNGAEEWTEKLIKR